VWVAARAVFLALNYSSERGKNDSFPHVSKNKTLTTHHPCQPAKERISKNIRKYIQGNISVSKRTGPRECKTLSYNPADTKLSRYSKYCSIQLPIPQRFSH
jgi:hypothetical protein